MNDKEILEHINTLQIAMVDMAKDIHNLRLLYGITVDKLNQLESKVNACMTRINELGCYEE